jgi:hypothetical protein
MSTKSGEFQIAKVDGLVVSRVNKSKGLFMEGVEPTFDVEFTVLLSALLAVLV